MLALTMLMILMLVPNICSIDVDIDADLYGIYADTYDGNMCVH